MQLGGLVVPALLARNRSQPANRPDQAYAIASFCKERLGLLDQRPGFGKVALQERKAARKHQYRCPQFAWSVRPGPQRSGGPAPPVGVAAPEVTPAAQCRNSAQSDLGLMLDRPCDRRADVADLAVDDRQPFMLIMTGQLRCRALDKITVVLGVPLVGEDSVRMQRELAPRVLSDQLQQPEPRLLAALV